MTADISESLAWKGILDLFAEEKVEQIKEEGLKIMVETCKEGGITLTRADISSARMGMHSFLIALLRSIPETKKESDGGTNSE